jgi:hypothetical protein
MIQLKKILIELEYPLASNDEMDSYRGVVGWKGKIVYMSPNKFLRLAAKLPDEYYSQESIKKLTDRIISKLPIDPLVLIVDMSKRKVVGHEGRHRAKASKNLGISSVPVLIYTGGGYDRVPDWTKEQHLEIDLADFLPEKP